MSLQKCEPQKMLAKRYAHTSHKHTFHRTTSHRHALALQMIDGR